MISTLGGAPRRLTFDPADDRQPAWSPDGQWIYFVSSRGGGTHVWRQPSSGGSARAGEPGSRAPSPPSLADGRFLFARAWPNDDEIWRMPAAGGAAEVGPGIRGSVRHVVRDTHRDLLLQAVAARARSPSSFRYDLATSRIHRLAVVDGPVSLGLTVSPDETVVLFARNEQVEADLQMLERPPLE